MLGYVFCVIRNSLVMSILAVLYLIYCNIRGYRIAAKWKYYGWLPVVVGFIIPYRPAAQLNLILDSSKFKGLSGNQILTSIQKINSINTINLKDAFGWKYNGIFWVWLTGTLIFLVCIGMKHLRLMKMIRKWSIRNTDPQLLKKLMILRQEMKIKQQIHLCQTACAATPSMIGIIKPTILLSTVHRSESETLLILKHELIHCKRKDNLFKLLAILAIALNWFNPIIYLVVHEISKLCELSCDDEVMKDDTYENRKYYCELILSEAVRKSTLRSLLIADFSGEKNRIRQRLVSIMYHSKKKSDFLAVLIIASGIFATSLFYPGKYEVKKYSYSKEKIGDTAVTSYLPEKKAVLDDRIQYAFITMNEKELLPYMTLEETVEKNGKYTIVFQDEHSVLLQKKQKQA